MFWNKIDAAVAHWRVKYYSMNRLLDSIIFLLKSSSGSFFFMTFFLKKFPQKTPFLRRHFDGCVFFSNGAPRFRGFPTNHGGYDWRQRITRKLSDLYGELEQGLCCLELDHGIAEHRWESGVEITCGGLPLSSHWFHIFRGWENQATRGFIGPHYKESPH